MPAEISTGGGGSGSTTAAAAAAKAKAAAAAKAKADAAAKAKAAAAAKAKTDAAAKAKADALLAQQRAAATAAKATPVAPKPAVVAPKPAPVVVPKAAVAADAAAAKVAAANAAAAAAKAAAAKAATLAAANAAAAKTAAANAAAATAAAKAKADALLAQQRGAATAAKVTPVAPKPAPVVAPKPSAPVVVPHQAVAALEAEATKAAAASAAAAAAAKAAQTAAASAASTAALLKQQQIVKQQKELAIQLAEDAARSAAALAASAAVARQQQIVKRQRELTVEMTRDAEVRAAERAALLPPRAPDQAAAEMRQIKQAAAERVVAYGRKQAFDALQHEIVNQRLIREAYMRKDQLEVTRLQKESAMQLRLADEQLITYQGPHGTPPESETAGDVLRRVLLNNAVATGDWSEAVITLQGQANASGGRYVDEQLVGLVFANYILPVQKIGDDFSVFVDQFNKMDAAGDINGIMDLLQNPDFLEAQTQFNLYYSAGSPAAAVFAKNAGILEQIRVQREKLWIATLSGANAFASQAEIDRLYAQAQLVADTDGGPERVAQGPFAGKIISPTSPLVYRETVIDLETGKKTIELRTGLAAWEAREQARAVDRAIAQYSAQANEIMSLNLQNIALGTGKSYGMENGQLIVVDAAAFRRAEQLHQWLPGSGKRFDDIAKMNPYSPATRQTIQTLMGEAERAYDKNNPRPLGADAHVASMNRYGGAYAPNPVGLAYDRARALWLDKLWKTMVKDGSSYDWMQSLGAGAVGVVTSSFLTVGSAVLTGVGLWEEFVSSYAGDIFGQDWGGHITLSGPSYDSTLLGPSSPGVYHGPSIGWEKTDQAKMDTFLAAVGDPSPNLITRLGVVSAAVRDFGPGSAVGGGLGWIAEGLLDPTNYIGPSLLMKPAKLAIAAGGGRAILGSSDNLLAGLAAFKKYAMAPSHVVQADLAKLAFGRKFGIPAQQALQVKDDILRGWISAAAKGDEALRIAEGFDALVDKTGMLPEQLSAILQQELPKIADEFHIKTANPHDVQARMAAVKATYDRATAEMAQAATMRARSAIAADWREAAKEAGANIPVPRDLAPAQLKQYTRLLTAYDEISTQFFEASQRAMRAAEKISDGSLAHSPRELQQAQFELRWAERDLVRFEDHAAVNPELPAELGAVGKALKEVRDYAAKIGGDPLRPAVTDTMRAKVVAQSSLVSRRISSLSKQIAKAPTPEARAPLLSRLDALSRVKQGLAFQKKSLLTARQQAKALSHADVDRIRPAVPGRRIAPVATNYAERSAGMGRELRSKSVRADGVRPGPAESPEDLDAFAAARGTIMAGRVPTTRAVRGFLAKTGPLNLHDLWTVLYKVSRSGLGDDLYGKAFWAVNLEVAKLLKQHGLSGNPKELAARLWGVVAEPRAGTKAVGLKEFRAIDADVAKALRDLRKRAAEGQVRLRGGAGSSSVTKSLTDDDPFEILAIMKALAKHDLTIMEYDELRWVLSGPMIQENVAKSILNRLRKMPGWSALSQAEKDAAFIAERRLVAERELLRNYEEFAARAENQGLVKEMLLRRFEEQFMARELGAGGGYKLSQLQFDALDLAFREQAGFGLGDTGRVADFLQGRALGVPAGGRLMREGEYIVPDGFDPSRVFVVAPDSDYLVNAVPWARARGDDQSALDRVVPHIRDSGTSEVTTRNLFDMPANAKEAGDYSLWVWHQMQTSPIFRVRMWKIGRDPAGFDKLFMRDQADVLARAFNYLKSPDGRRKFLPHAARGVTPKSASAIGEGRWREALEQEKVKLLDIQKKTRAEMGLEFQVRPEKQWLGEISDALHAMTRGGRRLGVEGMTDAGASLRLMGAFNEEEVALIARLKTLIAGSPGSKVADYVSVSELNKLRGAIDEIGVRTVSDILVGRRLPKRWFQKVDATYDATGKLAWRLERVTARLEEIRGELKAGPPVRGRGALGLSIAGDAVYIAEGTSNVNLAHEVFHQWWDDAANAVWVSDVERSLILLGTDARDLLWDSIRIGDADFDPAEFAAELYALWRVGDAAGSDVRFAWRDLLEILHSSPDPAVAHGAGMLEQLGRTFDGFAPRITATLTPSNLPPLHNRGLMFDWFVERGILSKKVAEEFASDSRAWLYSDEAMLYEVNFGVVPPWADRDVLLPLLDDPQARAMAHREWGYFDGGADQVMGGVRLTPKQAKDGVGWGVRNPDGTWLRRPDLTYAEIRQRAYERYGDLVSADKGKTFHTMPQLMRIDTGEYDNWLTKMLDPDFEGARRLNWEKARPRLPKFVSETFFDGDYASQAGLRINRSLVKPHEIQRLNEMIVKAMRNKFKRLEKMGDLPSAEFWPQEQLAFAKDIFDQLMLDPAWRSKLRGWPLVGNVLGVAAKVWGQIFRLLVAWQPAFPIMNVIDSYGFKRGYLALYENEGRPLSLSGDGHWLIRDLDEIDDNPNALFGIAEDVNWFGPKIGPEFAPIQRLGALAAGIRDLPMSISAMGERQLRLDFARSVAGRFYRGAIKDGMDPATAATLARLEAKRMNRVFFAPGPKAGSVEFWLNEIVPFASYQFRNRLIGLKMVASHPSVWLWGQRIQSQIEASNRAAWDAEHPGIPMPDTVDYKRLHFTIGGTEYTLDLTAMSDWTRAMKAVTTDQSLLDWVKGFVRIPHPEQKALWALLTGGMTPWGKPGDLREMIFWVDLFRWMTGDDYTKRFDQRDAIQVWGQVLFFGAVGRIDPLKVKLHIFFTLGERDKRLGEAYLKQNPDVEMYLDALNEQRGAALNWVNGKAIVPRWSLLSKAERKQYSEDYDGWLALNRRLNANIAEFAAMPWSAEFRAAKEQARIARTMYMSTHPSMVDYWGIWMSPAEFAAQQEEWRVDEMADSWFAWSDKIPKREAYKTDLAFQTALVHYNEVRAAYLAANPALMQRLYGSRSAVEYAWNQQELHWTEILDFTARLKLEILIEDAKGAAADRDLIDMLYDIKNIASDELNAVSYNLVFGGTGRGSILAQIKAAATTGLAVLPGFGQQRLANATPAERVKILADDRYNAALRAIGDIVDKLPLDQRGKRYYELLAERGLLDEYFRRNPAKKAAFVAGRDYFRWISSWVEKLKADNFVGAQAVWDQMPAWVKNKYFAAHPDSGMRDGMGGGGGTAVQYKGQWFKTAASRDKYIQFVEGQTPSTGPSTAVLYKGQWFKSPESRDRYIQFVEGGGSGGTSTAVQYKGIWFKSPASRDRYIQFIEGGSSGGGGTSTAVQYKGIWFKTPASRDRYIQFIEGGGSTASSTAVQYKGIWFKTTASRDRYIQFIEGGGSGGGGTAVQYKGIWFKSPATRDRYIQFIEGGGSGSTSTAVQYKGQWFKTPASRDRYIQFVEGGGQPNDFNEPFVPGEPGEFGEPGEPFLDGEQRFTSPEARARFEAGQQYYAAIGGWIALLEAKDLVGADQYFRAMPQWMKEKYWDKHPDQRAKGELDSEALRRGAEYFLASGDDKLNILARYPGLRAWLLEHGGEEAAFRGLVQAMYRAIPITEQWLRRTFRDRFPEIFSKEAAGERALAGVARSLAEHPDMVPFYERALRLQQGLFMEQLKRSKVAPKPMEMVRKKRLARKARRRYARLSSHWTTHKNIRAGILPAGA